jgi:Mg2+/Co2+ transporter CorB
MNGAGWIVAAVLAAIVLLALLFRARLLAACGYALRPIEPPQPPDRNGEDEDGDDARREGAAAGEERNRLEGLFDLDELEVSDVMVHRTNMRSVNADNAPEAVVREILTSPHTRMPLWKGSLDNIVGVLHAKDLLRALNEVGNDFSQIDVMKIAAKPWFVPDTTTLQEQLNAFLRR